MAATPKLEFYKFRLAHKDGKKMTFRQFAIDQLKGSRTISNDEAFKLCFNHFISEIETKHSKSEKKNKTITLISDAKANPYLKFKPTPLVAKNLIVGVINGGPYNKDAIVSDINNRNDISKLARSKAVLLPFFILVYIPSDYHEGLFAIHSYGVDDNVTGLFRSYISKLFSGPNFNQAIPESFCPKSFQDEFRKDAIIKNISFSTTVLDNTHTTDPIKNLLKEYKIKIEAIPKSKKKISITDSSKVLDYFKNALFMPKKDKELALNDFDSKKLTVENEVTKRPKVFEWNTKDNDFAPAVYLEERVKIDNGVPDFQELKKLCLNLFEDEILHEIRPDLNVTKAK